MRFVVCPKLVKKPNRTALSNPNIDASNKYFEALGILDISELTSGGQDKETDPNLDRDFGAVDAPVSLMHSSGKRV